MDLLNWLGTCGYCVSAGKAQIAQKTVKYLGYGVSKGQWTLLATRRKAICKLKPPENRQQLRGFLGMPGFCRIWLLNLGLMAKPLHEASRGSV